MAIGVTTKPHRVEDETGKIHDFRQSLVYLDGHHVGYIGDHKEAPLNLIYHIDDARHVLRLQDHFEETRGFRPAVSMPPSEAQMQEALAAKAALEAGGE